MARDLTKGNLISNLFYMSIPTMTGFALQALYDIVDMMWIGRISASAVAGVAVFSAIFWLVEVLNEIIGASSISLISQNYGAKKYMRTARVIEQTITFKSLMAIIASVFLLLFLKPLMMLFSSDSTVLSSGLDYGYWRTFFLPVFFSSYTNYTALRNIGDSKTPMIIMGVSALLNIFLDPVFMFDKVPLLNVPGFGMGVSGAAIATVISTCVAFIWGFLLLTKGVGNVKISLKGLLTLDKQIDLKLLTIGLPSGIEMLMRNLSHTVLLKFISRYGTSALAAFGIVSRLFGLAFIPLVGFSMGTSAIVGQNIGAENIKRAEKTVLLAVLFGMLFVSIFVVVSNVFPERVVSLFVQEKDVITVGAQAVVIVSWSVIIASATMSLMSAFFGAGYTFPAFVSSVIGRWFVQVPYVIITVTFLKLPIDYIWYSFIFAELAEACYSLYVFRKGKWKTIRVG